MKIALDATALVKNKTGVGNYIFEILSYMVQNQSLEFILYSNQNIYFPEHPNVTKIVHMPYRKGPAWQNTQLTASLFRDKPDFFWGGNGYLPIFTPKKTKLILTIHDLVYKYAGETMPFFSKVSRLVFQPLSIRNADFIIAVSNATASQIKLNKVKVDSVVHPQISKVYKIANPSINIRTKYNLENFILTLGTLEPRKNMLTLIKAYLAVINNGYKLPVLAIAGGKGWMQGELDKVVNEGVKSGHIVKLGFVPDRDMQSLYTEAEAFILASTYEGFGMPVLEAQACGCPVLTSDFPAIIEAAGDICCAFPPDYNGIIKVLKSFSRAELPLVCRIPSTINNDPELAARTYLKFTEDM